MRFAFACGAGVGACLLLSGCLTFEKVSVGVTFDDRKVGSYAVEFSNIQSDSRDAAAQQEDFDELMRLWRDDDYLLEAVGDGRYIKTRSLSVERGVLVGRETGVFRMADQMSIADLSRGPDGTLRSKVDRDEYVSSNGTWVPDSGFVRWPPGTKELKVEARARKFESFGDFAKRFQAREGAR